MAGSRNGVALRYRRLACSGLLRAEPCGWLPGAAGPRRAGGAGVHPPHHLHRRPTVRGIRRMGDAHPTRVRDAAGDDRVASSPSTLRLQGRAGRTAGISSKQYVYRLISKAYRPRDTHAHVFSLFLSRTHTHVWRDSRGERPDDTTASTRPHADLCVGRLLAADVDFGPTPPHLAPPRPTSPRIAPPQPTRLSPARACLPP